MRPARRNPAKDTVRHHAEPKNITVKANCVFAFTETMPALDYVRAYLKKHLGFLPSRCQALEYVLHTFKLPPNPPSIGARFRTVAVQGAAQINVNRTTKRKIDTIAGKLGLFTSASIAVAVTTVAASIKQRYEKVKRQRRNAKNAAKALQNPKKKKKRATGSNLIGYKALRKSAELVAERKVR